MHSELVSLSGKDFPPRVSVLIVNYNSGEYLARCLKHLRQQTLTDWEAIVLDNGSADDSLARAECRDPRIRIVRLGANLGFAAANNRGIALVRGRWVATLNPDAFPAPDWLDKLLDAAERYPLFRFFGSTQISAERPDRLDGAGDCYHFLGIPWRGGYGQPVSTLPPEGEVFSPCAAAALYSTELLREAGGFDESFFCYCEDVDLAFRLRLRGERCLQVKGAVVYHQGSAICGVNSPFSLYHGSRNRLWIFLKNMPAPLLPILLPLHLLATAYLLLLVANTPRLRPSWEGWLAGFRGMGNILREREKIQAARRISSWQCFSTFTWSFATLQRRHPDIRPVPSFPATPPSA